jgi:ring-1,2-phenylacetyl-CoA epoxidase subunit PaaE
MIASISAGPCSNAGRDAVVPALLMTVSKTRPFSAASTDFGSATSISITSACPPSAAIFAESSDKRATRRAANVTSTSCPASSSAKCSPNPEELADDYQFIPGQYVTLRRADDIDGVRRCYSVSSGRDDGELRVLVKLLVGGAFSSFVHSELQPGTELDVMTPEDTFGSKIRQGGPRTYLALAPGSGTTPIISIIRSVLATEAGANFILFYGSRTLSSIIFRDELNDLKDTYPGRFSLFHTLTREGTDSPLFSGRLDAEKLRKFSGALFAPAEIEDAFLCGPAEMIQELKTALRDLGVEENRFHDELFAPADADNTAAVTLAPLTAEAATGEGVQVTAILDGTARSFVMTPDQESVVSAAAAGFELPYCCKGAMCSTCRAKVIEGEAEMSLNYALEPR